MKWKELDDKLTKSDHYKFFQKHQRLWIFIQGFIVIGLLTGVIIFMIQDHKIKEQIRDNCGYTNDNYECVCTPHAANYFKGLDTNFTINFTDNSDDELLP